MQSTEAIMTSDYPLREANRQHFGENRHPDSGNRPFHPLIGGMARFACPEMTTFGNAAGQSARNDVLGDGKGPGKGFPRVEHPEDHCQVGCLKQPKKNGPQDKAGMC
jgi:hypothetical protein